MVERGMKTKNERAVTPKQNVKAKSGSHEED